MAARSVRPSRARGPGSIDTTPTRFGSFSIRVQPSPTPSARFPTDSGSETAHGARTGASAVSEFAMLNAFMPVPSNRE
jgi:hypothetical protein